MAFVAFTLLPAPQLPSGPRLLVFSPKISVPLVAAVVVQPRLQVPLPDATAAGSVTTTTSEDFAPTMLPQMFGIVGGVAAAVAPFVV